MNLVKRFFVFALMLTTVFSMSAFTLNVEAAGNYPAGSLLALENVEGSAVYYIGADGMKYVFPDPKTYATWYENFDSVVRVPVSELDMYPDGGAITYRPGTKLITHPNTNNVYAVEPGGMYCLLPSEAVAVALYGANWTSMVQDVIPGFFSSSYSDGNCELSDTLPDGTLVSMDGTYYYIENGMKRPFASSDAFEANNFNYMYVIEVDDLSSYSDGSSITGEEEALAGYMPGEGGTVTPPTVYGDLNVALSGSSPMSGNVVTGVDNVPFAKFVFTAGSGDVTVQSVRIGRKGLGSTSDFTSVSLYEGATKLGSTRTSWSSDDTINFNIPGGWDIDSGDSRELTVVANLSAANTYNALGIVDIVLADGNFDGSLPMYGKEMTGVSVTVGTVTITDQGTGATKKIGTTDVDLAEFKLALNNVEDGHFTAITLKNKAASSNATDNDVSNLKLYMGSEMLAGPVNPSSDKVVFELEEPYAIEKNKNETFKVVGDVVDGAGNQVEYVLDATTDLTVVGQTYGTALTVSSGAYDAAGEGSIIVIDGAELNVAFSSSPVDTMDDVDDVVFGTLTLSAGATDIKITEMVFKIDETGVASTTQVLDVDEFELLSSEGTAYSGVDSTGSDATAADETWTFDEEIYLVAGESQTFTLRGDLPPGIGDGDSYKVIMADTSTGITAETVPAGDAVSNFSIASLNGKLVTVQQPYITVKETAQNTDNAVVNSEDVSLFKGTVKATAGDVRVTRMKFEGASTTVAQTFDATSLDEDNFNGLTLWIDGVAVDTESGSNISSGVVDFNDFDHTFANGDLTTFEVTADIAATLDSTNTSVRIQLDTVTAKDSNNDDASVKNAAGVAIATGAELGTSRILTLTDKGVLYVSLRAADVGYNKARVALAGNDYWVAKLRMRAEYEDVKVEDFKLTNLGGSSADDSVDEVCIYNEATASAEYLVGCTDLSAGIAFYEDLNYVVELGSEDWYVYVKTNEMGNGALQTADTKDAVQFVASSTAGHIVARGNDSNELMTMGNANGAVAAGEIVFDYNLNGTFDESGVDVKTSNGPEFVIAGSKIATVELVNNGGTVGGEIVATTIAGTGEYTLGILAITTETSNNTDANGNALIANLNNLRFDVTKHSTTTFSGATIERIGGSVGEVALTTTGADAIGETNGDWTLANVSSTLGVDATIENGETAYFVVKGTVSGLDATTGVVDWVRVSLDDLNGASTTLNNIDWFDGYDTTYADSSDFDYLRFDTGSITGPRVEESL